MKQFSLLLTGASGAVYGKRLLEVLVDLGHHVDLVVSASAEICLKYECQISAGAQGLVAHLFPDARKERVRIHAVDNIASALASGSALRHLSAGIIAPASMGTCSRIAHGHSGNLIERHADVLIKERKTLVIVPRETPMSIIHLENLLKLAQAGCVILPAAPGFYHQPQQVCDLVDQVVGKTLDMVGVEHQLFARWKG